MQLKVIGFKHFPMSSIFYFLLPTWQHLLQKKALLTDGFVQDLDACFHFCFAAALSGGAAPMQRHLCILCLQLALLLGELYHLALQGLAAREEILQCALSSEWNIQAWHMLGGIWLCDIWRRSS